jgi:hypothetical protein
VVRYNAVWCCFCMQSWRPSWQHEANTCLILASNGSKKNCRLPPLGIYEILALITDGESVRLLKWVVTEVID